MGTPGIVSRKGLPVRSFAMAIVLAIAFTVLAVQASSLWSARSLPGNGSAVSSGAFLTPHVGNRWSTHHPSSPGSLKQLKAKSG